MAPALERIRVLLSDVDGVMTDGSLVFDAAGLESKTFHVRDGLGVKLWARSGGVFGVVTGRTSEIVARRALELGIPHVLQGVEDKLPAVTALAARLGVTLGEVAYLGDDLPDVPVLAAVGLGIAPADGVDEARAAARIVTRAAGGRGVVREAVEAILRGSGRWDAALGS